MNRVVQPTAGQPDAVVLGGAGFIGRHVCQELASRGMNVTAVGHGAWSADEARRAGISRWIAADIDADSLQQATAGKQPKLLVHCAGSGSVAYSYSAPLADFTRSVATVAALLEAARLVKTDDAEPPRVVIASSAAIYGDQGDIDLTESASRSPMSPYGFHKAASEILCDSYTRFFGLQVSIVRLFSVYGEGLRKQLLWDAMGKFERGESEFFGTGHEMRDWIHVEDAARLLCDAGLAQQAALEIYNGGASKVSIRNVLESLAAAAGHSGAVRFNGQTHTGNPRRLTADSSHAKRQLGWTPKVSLESGLQRYVEWFRGDRA